MKRLLTERTLLLEVEDLDSSFTSLPAVRDNLSKLSGPLCSGVSSSCPGLAELL